MHVEDYQLTWARGFLGLILWKKWDLSLYFGYAFDKGGVEASYNFSTPYPCFEFKAWPLWLLVSWTTIPE